MQNFLAAFASPRRIILSAAQIALAWLLRRNGVIAVPKAGTVAHVVDNRGAAEVQLGDENLVELERSLPPPTRRHRLEML